MSLEGEEAGAMQIRAVDGAIGAAAGTVSIDGVLRSDARRKRGTPAPAAVGPVRHLGQGRCRG
eukprot:12054-Eustigmatos_ZCMA.PRE.1